MVEILVVIGIIVILVGIILAAVLQARASADSLHCLNNIRQVTTGLRMYAGDWNNRFPNPALLNVSWESTLQQYLPDRQVFRCPLDLEVAPATGSSYDWRDTGNPETTLAGKSINAVPRNLVLAMEALPGWHKPRKVNVGRIDGSVESIGDQELVVDLMTPVHGP